MQFCDECSSMVEKEDGMMVCSNCGYDGGPVVVILDEADHLDSTDIFYNLHSLPTFAKLIVANERDHLFGRLNSRPQSSEHVLNELARGSTSERRSWRDRTRARSSFKPLLS